MVNNINEKLVYEKIRELYGNKTRKYNGITFAWCYAKQGVRVITLSPTIFAECIDGNIYMLRTIETWFTEM